MFKKINIILLIISIFIITKPIYATNSIKKQINSNETTNIFSSEIKIQESETSIINFNTNATTTISESDLTTIKENTNNNIKNAIKTKQKEEQTNKTIYNNSMSVSDNDLDILAKIIYAEAHGESYQGKVAVGAVVLNRVRSSRYPNTIKNVVFARNQFTPVSNGSYYSARPGTEEYNAAKEALSGVDPTNGALTFYAYKYSKSAYHESLTHTVTIGGHKFFK